MEIFKKVMSNSPFLNYFNTGTQHLKPQMKHLLIQSQTYQAAQFHIHLRMRIVM